MDRTLLAILVANTCIYCFYPIHSEDEFSAQDFLKTKQFIPMAFTTRQVTTSHKRVQKVTLWDEFSTIARGKVYLKNRDSW